MPVWHMMDSAMRTRGGFGVDALYILTVLLLTYLLTYFSSLSWSTCCIMYFHAKWSLYPL